MVFQPVPNTAEISINGVLAGQFIQNTYHFENPMAWEADDLGVLCDKVMTRWNSYVVAHMGAGYLVNSVEARGLRNASDVFSFSAVTGAAGGLVSPTLPNNVCLSVARLSGLTGRSYRGRVYIPVNVTGHLASTNTVGPPFILDIETCLNAIRVIGVAEGWINVIVSRQNGGVPRAVATVTPVISYQVRDNVLDSQRRRLPGRGM